MGIERVVCLKCKLVMYHRKMEDRGAECYDTLHEFECSRCGIKIEITEK